MIKINQLKVSQPHVPARKSLTMDPARRPVQNVPPSDQFDLKLPATPPNASTSHPQQEQ